MSQYTFAEKALARAAGLAAVRAGEIVEVSPDRILSHDNSAAIARLFHEQLGGQKVVDPERICITLDHAVPPPTPRHADNHAEVRAFVQAQGIRHFFEIGRGICHQVLSEEALVLPGQVILGADSHTTHFGWLGAFGAGVGRSEVAVLWATGRLWLRVPESVRFTLYGNLAPGVTSKDLCLAILAELDAAGGLYTSVEFAGPGLDSLSLESRMVIPNMMAEFDVKCAYLPPDDLVFDYLAGRFAGEGAEAIIRQRIEGWAIYPDAGARYLTEYELNLDRLEPLLSCPHAVDHVQPLSAVSGQRVDLAFIGTCTNGRLEDLAAAAEVLRGRRVHPGTRLLIVPASSQVYRQALQAGILEPLLAAGAIIGTPGCGPCMGNHMGIPAAGEVVISSANRNFRGRMGQPAAEVYLASPAVVAASAVKGYIAHPVELIDGPGASYGGFNVIPSESRDARDSALKVARVAEKLPGAPISHRLNLEGGASPPSSGKVWKYGDDVNTELIFPGKYTYTAVSPAEIAAHALEDLDPSFIERVQAGDIVFAGRNWGCGSSREQAAACLKYNGVAAVVAISFGRIFYRNAINQGLPAIVCPLAVAAANSGEDAWIDWQNGLVHLPAGAFPFPPFPEHIQEILAAGGLIPAVKRRLAGGLMNGVQD
jgi:3-isopropylmalate/(R)-2-methylmalate dehydratase large subunit